MNAGALPFAESERRSALQAYGGPETSPETAFDELVALAARVCGMPIALVTLIDHDRPWLKAHHGLGLAEVSRAVSFCAHALAQPGELLLVADAANDPRFADHPFVTGAAGLRFYAGVPLCPPAGHVIGTLCVADRLPRALDPGQQEALRVLGRQVMTQLELGRNLKAAGLNRGRLENSQRIAGLGDWEYNFPERRLVWSAEVYRILGISEQDFPANSETFYRRVHPDDLERVRREKKAAAQGFLRVNFEHRIVRPDGAVRHIQQIAELICDDRGRPLRESGTLQDITERKLAEEALRQSEERFKFVARAGSDVVWDWNIPGNTFWWNDGFLTAFGFAVGEIEPSVESWTGRVHPEDRAGVVAGIWRAIDSDAISWSAEYRFQRKDGSHACVQDRGYILRDTAGRAIRMVGGMRDLTVQKKMEAQYLRAQRMESIGTLAGGIAHDLNNVLAPIMMSIELLKADLIGDPRRTKILDVIYNSSRRGAELVRQVLAFASGLEGPPVAIRLHRLIAELENIIGETFPRNIRIRTAVADDLWPIMGDPSQLQQVLLNLAVNARDAMPEGGALTVTAGNLTLDAESAAASSDARAGLYVLLQVSDTGQGIPPEVRGRIFEPFFTTKELGKGTGLGLATVHNVVKRHSGFIGVESAVGHGTTFKIYLAAAPAQRPAATLQPFSADLPRGNGELVLLVDDEPSIRDITQQTLEAFGYRVLAAGDGAEAVALYARRSQEISLVLTDMMMALMDGSVTMTILLRINPAVRIIAASGLEVTENVAKAMKIGVHDFLAKPYTAATLLRRIREVLDRPVGIAP